MEDRNPVVVWWTAARPFSLTVSIVPPILGSLLAMMENQWMNLRPVRFVLCLLGCVIAHAGSNLLSDYYDYIHRVDREETWGSSRMLVEGRIKPGAARLAGLICFLIAGLAGTWLIATSAAPLLLAGLTLLGLTLGVFYTAKPFQLKYHALGDISVFIAFGSAMTLGAYAVQAARFSWTPVLAALPVALLVDAILHSNNLRDMEHDRPTGIQTLAMKLGSQRAVKMYALLIYGAYILTLLLVIAGQLPVISLVVFLSLPLAFRLVKRVRGREEIPQKEFSDIDARTAQLHSLFSVLLIAALLVSYFVSKG